MTIMMDDQGDSSESPKEPISSENFENESQTVTQCRSGCSISTSGQELLVPSIVPKQPGMNCHQCGLCGATFSVLTQYLIHRVNDHGGQQEGMSCDLCGTAYSRQATLREHYKKKHRINFNSKPPHTSTLTRPPSNTQTTNGLNDQACVDRCSESIEERSQEKNQEREERNQEREERNQEREERNQESQDEDSSTQTIHVIITKTEEEGRADSDMLTKIGKDGRNNLDMLRKMEENGVTSSDILARMEGDGVTEADILRTGEEDMVLGNDGQTGQVHLGRKEGVEIDAVTTEINNVNNQSVPVVDDMDSENMNLEMDDSGASPSKVAESEASGLIPAIDESDDFHFVLLKNMINGNSFKYSKDRFKCLHCEFKSYWRNSICTHMKELHKDMMSIHQFIEIKPSENDNSQSDQTIMKMSDYITNLHQKKTRSAQYRIRSVEKQDLPGHFPCPKCNKEFNRLRYLRKHMLVHKTDKKYLCDECGKAFKTRSYLKTHYRTHKERLFKCSQCHFSSSVNAVIHAHRQLHNDGSVICDVCGFAYADKSTLKKHKLVHDPDRPFPCTFPGCTWRFKTKVMCLAHYNAHTTEGKFRCSVCGYVFRHKHHLQRHQGKMHGITNMTNVTIVEEEKKDEKDNEVSDVPDTVNLIVNSDFSRDQLQSALQNGQLVIATDSEGNTINYEVADITMNVTYHTLLEDESELGDTQTILHVATIDSQEDDI